MVEIQYLKFVEINRRITEDYETKKAKALKILRESLGYIARQCVAEEINAGDARAIWEKLENTYFNKDSVTNKGDVLEELTNITIGNKETIRGYINRFNNIADAVKHRQDSDKESGILDDTWRLSFFYNGIKRNSKRFEEFESDIKFLKRVSASFENTITMLSQEEISRMKFKRNYGKKSELEDFQMSNNTSSKAKENGNNKTIKVRLVQLASNAVKQDILLSNAELRGLRLYARSVGTKDTWKRIVT